MDIALGRLGLITSARTVEQLWRRRWIYAKAFTKSLGDFFIYRTGFNYPEIYEELRRLTFNAIPHWTRKQFTSDRSSDAKEMVRLDFI